MKTTKNVQSATNAKENNEADKKFTLDKINLILIAVGFLIIVIGFILMTGSTTVSDFNPDIFSTRRITVGPMISFFGFLFIIFAIMYKSKKDVK
jgi:uncharacterized membrane protein